MQLSKTKNRHMAPSSLNILRVIKWSHLSGWIFSYFDHLTKTSSHVLAYKNLCWSIGAKIIYFTSSAHSLYLIILILNHCRTAQALIKCSLNFCTWPNAMLTTFVISVVHVESCSRCHLTLSCSSTKSLGEKNYGRSMPFISWLIFSYPILHSAHFF